jgi:hypothetical protein
MATHLALALIGVGIALLMWSVWSNLGDMRRSLADPRKGLGLARWLRTTILGLAAIAVGVGWTWGIWPLVGLALVIAGEETLETTVVISAMKKYPGVLREVTPHEQKYQDAV